MLLLLARIFHVMVFIVLLSSSCLMRPLSLVEWCLAGLLKVLLCLLYLVLQGPSVDSIDVLGLLFLLVTITWYTTLVNHLLFSRQSFWLGSCSV